MDGEIIVLDTIRAFVGPTLFDHATEEMAIYREEIFGPVDDRASFIGVIALINANPYANGAAFYPPGLASRRFQQDVESA